MVTEDRESLRAGRDEDGESPVSPSRRFARLVESADSRRISPRRLARAVAASVIGLALVGFGGARLVRSVTDWVGRLPEYQLPFDRIELVPEPPPYIRAGAAGFLERVRAEARLGDAVPLLTADLAALETDFRRSPWVKDVTRVERSAGRLAVHLAYREPVAVAGEDGSFAVVIDEEGVILPHEDRQIDWSEKGPVFRVRGIDAPLIEIHCVSRPAGTLPGLPWKRTDGSPDLQVQGAARLARFLRGRDPKTPAGKLVPRLARMTPSVESAEYYLFDAGNRCIFWGEAPGAEASGMPRAEAKWAMLRAWIDEHGSLPSKPGEYLAFGPSGPRVGRSQWSARPKRSSSR